MSYNFVSILEKYKNKNLKVLDFGCGHGHWGHKLEEGNHVFYADLSFDKFQYSSERLIKITSLDGDIDIGNTRFDLILLTSVLHHCTDENALAILSKLTQKLSDDGKIILYEVSSDSPIIKLGRKLHPKYENHRVLSQSYKKDLFSYLEQNYLVIEEKFYMTNSRLLVNMCIVPILMLFDRNYPKLLMDNCFLLNKGINKFAPHIFLVLSKREFSANSNTANLI